MAAAAPVLEARDYQQLVDEALARIPVHTPEWTNFNRSDPGVTLVELFAFLTESLAYRSNQIPERNRRKFLSLLGVPLAPASSARGIVQLSNERGPLATVTLNAGIEVRAGQVSFRTDAGLDVVPVEGRAFFKRILANPPQALVDYYRQLYASQRGQRPELSDVQLYETVSLDAQGQAGVALQETADNSLWVALLLRPGAEPQQARDVREALAGKTLNLGFVPTIADPRARLGPLARSLGEAEAPLDFQLPQLPPGGALPDDPSGRTRVPRYRSLHPAATTNVLVHPGVVQLQLPADPDELGLWTNLDPLESGVGEFPPGLDDTNLAERLVTWVRIKAPTGSDGRLLWVGINAVEISQRTHVAGEVLPDATGEPDQLVRLTRTPVIPDSVRVTVTPEGGEQEMWQPIDDLLAAGPEVPSPDPRQPPGTPPPEPRESRVFAIDAVSGEIRFGDGTRGRRPPAGASLRADYDFGSGAAGNVGPGQISTAPALPAGIRAVNPVRTWGGAEAETVLEGEKQTARYLQHRDRLVTAEDFETIVRRTPGVELGRVEVLPAFNPDFASSRAGDAPGTVTLLVIPRVDALHPTAPEPDQVFLDAICRYIDPRRLVTTDVLLRGPAYKDIWISVGIEIVPGASIAAVREAVRAALQRILAPVDEQCAAIPDEPSGLLTASSEQRECGWPLGKAVSRLELIAVANRVPGVRLVNGVFVAEGTAPAAESIPMSGLELPRVRGIAVVPGDAPDVDQVRGQQPPDARPPSVVPVPVVPETC